MARKPRTELEYTYFAGYPNAVAMTVGVDLDLSATPSRLIYVGTAGDLKVDMEETGTGVVFKGVPAGFHRLAVKKIYGSGTTAGNVVVLY